MARPSHAVITSCDRVDPATQSERVSPLPMLILGRWRMPMTADEASHIETCLATHADRHGSLFGFVGRLLAGDLAMPVESLEVRAPTIDADQLDAHLAGHNSGSLKSGKASAETAQCSLFSGPPAVARSTRRP